MSHRAKAAMTLDQLLAFQRAEPFRPYRIHLADGKSLDVMHPEFVARSPSGRTATVYRPDGWMEVVDLLLVTRLHWIVTRGRRKARRTGGKSA